ncbi:hypothetical protein [Actinomadura gamaensis]|uniref:Tetratricopeptide repeat protein n=1 Tax=Actinomadura gamaensis TaxID=1763541 RepID=A0ABV9TVG5_9ACTN
MLADIIRAVAEGDPARARDLAALYSRARGGPLDGGAAVHDRNPATDAMARLGMLGPEHAVEARAPGTPPDATEPVDEPAAPGLAAGAALDRARRLAATVRGPAARRDALVRLARHALAAGHVEEARAVAALIADPGSEAEFRHEIIVTLAARGDLGRARSIASEIGSVRYRDLAFADIARIADAAGALDEADADAARIEDPNVRSLVQNELLRGAVTRRDFDRAEAVARSAAEPHVRTGLLLTVICALADAGRRDAALALAGELRDAAARLGDPLDRDWANLDVVTAIVGAGDPDGALRTAEAIGDPVVRVGALAEIAKAPATGPPLVARLLDRAAALAESLPGRADREAALQSVIRALFDIAAAAIRAGDVPRAEAHVRAVADLRARGGALHLPAETTGEPS